MNYHSLAGVRRRVCLSFQGQAGAIVAAMMTVGVLTMVVKLAGFGKDLVVAGRFGTADAVDAFMLAAMLPGMIAGILSGSLDALVPAHAQMRADHGEEQAGALAANGLRLYAGVLLGAMMLLYLVSAPLVSLLAPHFGPEKHALTLELLRWLLPFGWCYGISLYLGEWLQTGKKFAAAALGPALIPVCGVLFLLAGPKDWGIRNLAAGTVLGSIMLVAVLIRFVRRTGANPFLRSPELRAQTRSMARESLPLLAGSLLTFGIPLVDTTMAALLDPGSVAVLGYGEKICSIVLALLATSAGQVLYPYLADQAAHRDWSGMRRRLLKTAGLIAAAAIPATAAIWFSAEGIVSLLLERGAFGAGDADRVAAVLRCQALQIPFYIAAVLGAQVVNALRAGRFLLVTTTINLGLNVLLNWLLMQWLGLPGIALATAGVCVCSALMLYTFIFRELKLRELAAQ